ncbi:MAG: hypothetical protein JW862_12745 [Anaerolineales bacterium]|nr:hypothetical protein [Anaerolineales bacterium]
MLYPSIDPTIKPLNYPTTMPYPSPASLILVCYLPAPRDLEIARLLGWYRIPLRTAPKVVAVDWLAFYQPGSFGGQKWRIQVLAPLRGHELVTRAELFKDQPDHPRAHEEYFKLQLGALVELPAPILAGGWKRITFLYTTGEYLLAARTMRDLVVQQEERKLLWSALRERASQDQAYRSRPELPEVEVDPAVLAMLLGIPESGQALD